MEDANAAMKDPPKVVLRCKLCMVGDAGVGKTALTEVFTKGGSKFPKNYSMVRARSAACPSPSCARPSPAHTQANAQQTATPQTADPTFTVHIVDIPDTNMRVELCVFDVPGGGLYRESSLKLVRTMDAPPRDPAAAQRQPSQRRDDPVVRTVRGCGRHLRGV